MDEEDAYIEQLDPSTRGGGGTDILKLNIGRQMDRINRCFDSLNFAEGNEIIVFMKAATHIKILDAMINHKARRDYKEQALVFLDIVEKYENEIAHPPSGKLFGWWFYFRPLMKWYAIECAELSNLGIIPYDTQEMMDVVSKEDDVDDSTEST